ncbi:MAG: hypothetical protein ACRD97_10470, partial [Nitrososphaeraceae archaeon]
MEKSNGTMIALIMVAFSLVIYTIYFNQMTLAKEFELKSVGKGAISCDGGESVEGVRINFFVSYDKGTSFAEWNIDHEELG